MTSTQYLDVDSFLDGVLHTEDTALHLVRENCRRHGLPEIAVSPQQGKLLTLLVQMCNAKRVLEIGTLGGYSTICLARGLQAGAELISLELRPDYASVANENFKFAEVNTNIQIMVGDAERSLQRIATTSSLRAFDFVFIDADKESNASYVQWAKWLGRSGTIIVVDNVIRDGRVLTVDSKRDFIKGLGRDPKLDVSVIQTVGGKIWDGFALIRVK